MPQLLATLWTPAIWIKAMRERQATFPALFSSGTVQQTDLMNSVASGAGTSANIPFLKDITDQSDEVQVEATAPVNDLGAPGAVQVFPILNRVTKNSGTALAANVSGEDPVPHIIESLVARRLKQRQTTLVAMLRGLFGTAGAANVACALSGVRLGGTTQENFTETGLSATAGQLISPTMFVNAKALMGELADTLKDGCLLMHPNIRAALEIQDSLNFKTLQKPSDLPFTITTYRDIPIFLSNSLVRVGTTNGFVYDTYLLTKNTVGYGEKTQASDVKDVASLAYFYDRDLNDDLVWDRTRFVLGVDGTKWTGTPAGQSATNAELQTTGNWSLQYQSPDRVGAVCFRTNG